MYSDADGKPLTSRDALLPCCVSAVVGCVMRPIRGCDWPERRDGLRFHGRGDNAGVALILLAFAPPGTGTSSCAGRIRRIRVLHNERKYNGETL